MSKLPILWIDERERDEAPASFDPERLEIVVDRMDHGDYVWEGHGLDGPIMLAAEHKTVMGLIHSLVATNHHLDQITANEEIYDHSYFIVSGSYRRGGDGYLELLTYAKSKPGPMRLGSTAAGPPRPGSRMSWKPTSPPILYARFRKALFGIAIQRPTKVLEVRDFRQFTDDLTELVEWWSKPYNSHTSALAPSSIIDVRGWGEVARLAAQINGIGPQLASRVGRLFTTPRDMILARPEVWLEIERIGPVVVEKIMTQLQGKGWRGLPRYRNWFRDKNKLVRKARQK